MIDTSCKESSLTESAKLIVTEVFMSCVTRRLHLPPSFRLLHMHVLTYAIYTLWAFFFWCNEEHFVAILGYPPGNKI